MFYRGGILGFGKLTMHDTDLRMIDADPSDPFDFFPDHYKDQLVAGYSKTTVSGGLQVYMPDYSKVSKPLSPREAAREAHMRIEIAKTAKECEGAIAVVCGAWHVPALLERRSLAADRELLKGRPKAKIKATWAPWTAPRLARASGYGAGVVAPGWCAHLWATRDGADRGAVWLARVAYVLRDRGHFVSTASVIEAQRLGTALAALRDRPAPGFEELREAAIACLCGGERALWNDVAAELLIGSGVGSIPAATPLAPLLEDLQRQQKALQQTTVRLTEVYQELQDNFENMKRAERLYAIGQLSAGLAHEIRNPLGAMRGAIQVLQSSMLPDSVQTDLMSIILRESDRLRRRSSGSWPIVMRLPPASAVSIDSTAAIYEAVPVDVCIAVDSPRRPSVPPFPTAY